jgi:hypothetical protein
MLYRDRGSVCSVLCMRVRRGAGELLVDMWGDVWAANCFFLLTLFWI